MDPWRIEVAARAGEALLLAVLFIGAGATVVRRAHRPAGSATIACGGLIALSAACNFTGTMVRSPPGIVFFWVEGLLAAGAIVAVIRAALSLLRVAREPGEVP